MKANGTSLRFTVWSAILTGLMGIGGSLPVGAQVVRLQPVAYQGQAAPGAGASGTFSGLDYTPVIGNDGSVAFVANVTGGTASRGLWLGMPGSLTPVGLLSRPISDGSGQTWGGFNSQSLARLDLIGIWGASSVGSLWTGSTSGLTRVAREGEQAPGQSTGVLFDFVLSAINLANSGHIAFKARLKGSGVTIDSDESLWAGQPGSLNLVAREGSPAPGAGGASFASSLGGGGWPINDSGQIAFLGNLQGTGVTGFDTFGLWFGVPGSLNLIMRENGVAGSTGFRFDSAEIGSINNAGQLTFASRLRDDAFNVVGSSLWRAQSGVLTLMVRSGDAAPDLPAGTVFSSLPYAPKLLAQGDIVFEAYLSGGGVTSGNNHSIWAGSPGSYRLRFREGMAVPGVNGAQFNEPTIRPLVNGNGEIAVFATITGTGINSTNDFGLWATDPCGNLHLVVREGDALELGPDDRRTVASVPFVGLNGQGQDGLPRVFNDRDQLVFRVQFTDGSKAIFLATVGTEPVIQVIRHLGASVEVDFHGLTGKTYALESKDAAGAATWDVRQSGVAGNCGTATAVDGSVSGVNFRWYRVRQE